MGPSYDNGLGSFGNASSNGAGGAIISSSNSGVGVGLPSEGKKRWPVFVAIFLGIAAVVALVLMAVVPRGSGGDTASGDVDELLNGYVNYVINGEYVQTELDGEYDSAIEYALEKALWASDEEYFGNLEEYWNGYLKLAMEGVVAEEGTELSGRTEAQKQMMDFLFDYVRIGDLKEEDILKLYKDVGKSGVYERADEMYTGMAGSDFTLGADYAKARMQLIKATADLYEQYEIAGCLVEGVIDDECQNSSAEFVEAAKKYFEYCNYNELNAVEIVAKAAEENCFEMVNENVDDTEVDEGYGEE